MLTEKLSGKQNTVAALTAWKVSKYGVFSGPNAGKYGPEKTPYLDTFHADYAGQNIWIKVKESRKNGTGPESFNICFCPIFECYCQGSISERMIGH